MRNVTVVENPEVEAAIENDLLTADPLEDALEYIGVLEEMNETPSVEEEWADLDALGMHVVLANR